MWQENIYQLILISTRDTKMSARLDGARENIQAMLNFSFHVVYEAWKFHTAEPFPLDRRSFSRSR